MALQTVVHNRLALDIHAYLTCYLEKCKLSVHISERKTNHVSIPWVIWCNSQGAAYKNRFIKRRSLFHI